MLPSTRLTARLTPGPLLALFLVFAGVLWGAGGASRADASGQFLVRLVAWICLVAMIVFKSGWSVERGRAVLLFWCAATALAIVQILPLPPAWWLGLPGRAGFENATAIAGGGSPWRPLAIYPSGAINALGSLIVPFVTLCFITGRHRIDDRALLKVIWGMVIGSMLVGLLQFAGVGLRNPLVAGNADVSGTFANRNHFALLMASGFLLTSAWAFSENHALKWRGPVAIALALMLALAILASGSRAGMLVGIAALGCASLMVQHQFRRALARYPRWVFLAALAGIVGMLAVLVAISIGADRAVAVDRAFTVDPARDMRSMGLPTVIDMVREYFPVGSGLGGFDAVFRIHEPFELLKPTYFNRAHNDFMEIVLDAGFPGLVLILLGLGWWARMSVRAWRAGPGTEAMLPKLGSALMLIILLASVVDYPARTPVIMALGMIACVWLSEARSHRGASALPKTDQHL